MKFPFLFRRAAALAYDTRKIICKFTCVAVFSLSASVAAAGTVTIAALGDSLTHGYGLPPDEGFTVQLENWLNARGADVEVLNAGVSGDTTAGGKARLDWTLTSEVDAIIVELGANDMLRAFDPAVTRANLDHILAETARRGLPTLLAGISAPANYGPDYKREFDSIFPDLAAEHGALLYPQFFAAIGADEDIEAARKLMQSDGIHPNAEGVAAIVADIGPLVEELVRRARAE
jgi:acyl-CoA thioesterase-1